MVPTPTMTPWPGNEPGYRLHGADGAGVGDAHGDAGEIVGAQVVVAHLADHGVVALDEVGEVERVGLGDARHQQRAGPVGLLHVHRDAQADVVVTHHSGAGGRPR